LDSETSPSSLLGRVGPSIRPAWTNHNFDLIFAARVAMSCGRALAGVVTPIYLALEGFSAFEISVYVVVVSLASAAMSTLIGASADRIGRKPFMVGLPLLTTAAAVVYAVTAIHPVLFLAGALGSFGRGAGAGAGAVGPYQPAESALATDSVAAEHRNSMFGRLAFASSGGATAGGLLALLVTSSHVHGAAATVTFRASFVAIAVVSGLAGIIAVGLDEPARTPRKAGQHHLHWPRRSSWLVYRLWITNSFNGAAVGMLGPFLTYWFFRRYGVGAAEVGVLYSVVNALTMASSLSASGLARRYGLVRTSAVMRAAQALLIVPLVLAPNFELAGAVYLVRMVTQRISLPLRQSYTLGLAVPDERAAVAAISNLPSQLAMSSSPLLTGYLFDEISLNLPFELAALLQLVNAGLWWQLFKDHPPEEERRHGEGSDPSQRTPKVSDDTTKALTEPS
jgi:MFS family permease